MSAVFWYVVAIALVVGLAATKQPGLLALGCFAGAGAITIATYNLLMTTSIVTVTPNTIRVRNGLVHHLVDTENAVVRWEELPAPWRSKHAFIRLYGGPTYLSAVLVAPGGNIELVATRVLADTFKPVLVSQRELVGRRKFELLNDAIARLPN